MNDEMFGRHPIRPLLLADLPRWERMRDAFERLLHCMAERPPARLDQDAAYHLRLVDCLRAVGEAIRATDFDYVLDGWNVAAGPGSYANTLMQLSRDPTPEGVARLLSQDAREPEFYDHMRRWVARFAEELLASSRPPNAPTNTLEQQMGAQQVQAIPFRPYRRPKYERPMPAGEYHVRVSADAFQADADEKELRQIGGRQAVLESIRRHLPTFDPAEAREPYGAAWMKLKPVLVRCGLNPVDETTTLTDIKGFLDATSPQSQESPAPYGDRAMPDPRRVFVIYGRNTAAYDQMVKFLRALKLDPRSFYDVSADSGPNATVLQIVRHGMAQATGVVALFTPDEWSVLRPTFDPKRGAAGELCRWQARPNVIFEAGLALGIAEKRTILVKLGPDVSLFSDVGGIHTVNLDNGHESRNLLRGKLKTAGCVLDLETGDHLHVGQAGDFETCLKFSSESAPVDPFAPATSRRTPAATKGDRGKKR
jgi:predicted nucleotide-binding protein